MHMSKKQNKQKWHVTGSSWSLTKGSCFDATSQDCRDTNRLQLKKSGQLHSNMAEAQWYEVEQGFPDFSD